jgi:hypothetical protein
MSERTIMAVVSDMRRHGLTVELQILVDELVMLTASLQAAADRQEAQRAKWREEKQCLRMSSDVQRSPKTPTPLRDKNKNKINPQSPLDAFSTFYQTYPKKVARRAALKAYTHSLKRGATDAELLAGAKRYAAEVVGREVQYIKAPAAWLNADCHLDESKVLEFRTSPPQRSWAEIKAEREAKEKSQ